MKGHDHDHEGHDHGNSVNYESIKESIVKNEGCHLMGFIQVKKVIFNLIKFS